MGALIILTGGNFSIPIIQIDMIFSKLRAGLVRGGKIGDAKDTNEGKHFASHH